MTANVLTNVRSIDEANQVENQQHRDQSPIDLSDDGSPMLVCEAAEKSSFFFGEVSIADLFGVDDICLVSLDVFVEMGAGLCR